MMHDWRSCTSVPTSFSGDDILNDCARLGRKAWICGVDHRQVDLADAEQRVAERQHAAAVDVGDGAGRDRAHVAAHQLDADRRARLDVARGRRTRLAAAARLQRHQARRRAAASASSATVRAREAGDRQRHRRAQQARLAGRDRRRGRAAGPARAPAPRARRCCGRERRVRDAARRRSRRDAPLPDVSGADQPSASTSLPERRGRARSASIVSIGVTPPSGSFAKLQA